MQEVMPFDFQGKSVRVIRDEQWEPWWVATDVCKVLDIANPRDAVGRLDDDEKSQVLDPSTVGNSDASEYKHLLNVVNESGLYHLIFRSNKPEAKDFRRWITHEVLPALRKTGQYTMPQAPTLSERFLGGRPWDQVVSEIGGIKAMLAMTGLDANQCALGAFQRYDALNGTRVMEVLPPDALRLTSPNQCAELRPSDLAQRFGVVFTTGRPDAHAVNRLLESLGFQVRTKGEMLDWTPTAKGWPFATIKDLPKNAGTGRSERQLFWLDTLLENAQVAQELERLGRLRLSKVVRGRTAQRSLDLH